MSFAVPLFLLAALAGAIPILLHMINRQQAPIVPFATVRFLRLAVERTRKRKYLHDVLLLTLRVLALVVIAIALARPMLAQLRHLFGASTASVVLIVDNSASLATKDQAGRRWDAAVHAAEQALDQLRDGDTAALILTCGPRRPETERLLSNHEVLRQTLAAAHPSLQRADLAARLHEARELLAKSPSPNKEIYIVTDMQAASWEGLSADADQAARTQPPVVVIDVHGASLPNVGLRGAVVQAAAPVVGVPMQAKVTVVGDPLVRQQTHVELLLDGRSQQISPTLTLEPGAALDYVFPLTIDQPGVHRGEMRIVGEDACPADDRAYFAVTVDPNIPVAIVKGRQHEVSYLDDSFYLDRALSPIAGGEWAIKATPLTVSALAAEPLSTYAVIFCVNVPPLEAPSAQRLAQYVQAGGRLVWIGGDNCDMVGYNGMNELAGSKLLPAPLAGVRERSPERPDGWRIGSLDDRHPALEVFASPPSLIQSVLVTKHVRLKTSGVSDLRVLARLDDGEPLMVQRAVGDGLTLFWGSSLHVDWTNFPLRPLFLPLLARLTFQLSGSSASSPQLTAGVPLLVPLAADSQPRGAEIVTPSGEVTRLTADAPDSTQLRYVDTHEGGVYRVSPLDPKQGHLYGVAVNIDPSETAGAILSSAELQSRFGRAPLAMVDAPEKVGEAIQRLRQGESLMELFLLIVLVALVAEVYVANRRIDRESSHLAPPR